MVLGSHNSWSYLTPTKWWMKLIRFAGCCQDVDIKTQYEKYNVRCFDLRVRFDDEYVYICHGCIAYKYNTFQIGEDLKYINDKKDCYVRVILDIRNEKDLTDEQVSNFIWFCSNLTYGYKNIKFWCGKELATWTTLFTFKEDPSCEENYSSVKPPKYDEIYPRHYAKKNNKDIIAKGTDKDILLIDFVNIQ